MRRHRGVKLCMEELPARSRARTTPGLYDFEGRLIAAPNLAKKPDIDPDKCGLAKVHLREYLGHMWVCYGTMPQPAAPPGFRT